MQKTIIFDMDGTLLYTLKDLQFAVNKALELYGYPIKTIQEIQSYVGDGVKKLIERALPSGMENPNYPLVFDEFVSQYEKNADKYTKPYDDILLVLDELKKRNYKLGVNSNKYDSAVKSLCEKYFPQIDCAIGAREGVEVKPSPIGALDVLGELKGTPDNCYFVGDSDIDVKTAKNAGFISIGVTWGYRSKQSLIDAGAQFIIEKPLELLEICK